MSLRVLFFRPTLGKGGADRVTITLLQHLDRQKFEPHIALARAEGALLREVPGDVPVHDLHARRLRYSWIRLVPLLRRLRPDVVFSTASGANAVAVIAREVAQVPCRLVLSERSSLDRGDSLSRRTQRTLKRMLYRRADCIAAVSAGVAHELEERMRLPASRFEVVYNPVVTEAMEHLARDPVEHPWFGPGHDVVLAVGRLVPEKDLGTLLEAFAIVRGKRPAKLVLLGDGPERDNLIARATDLQIQADVHFEAFDPNPYKYMARCAVYALSSHVEGLPGALIQAMACGAACVSTDCRHGPNEIIASPGRDGFLVPVGDERALAGRIEDLLADPQLRARVAARAVASARRFAVDSAIKRYEKVIVGN